MGVKTLRTGLSLNWALNWPLSLALSLTAIFLGRLEAQTDPMQGGQPTTASQVGNAPTDSDIYCAGFFSQRPVETGLEILGGVDGGFKNEFSDRDIIYLSKGSGWLSAPGGRYMVVRPIKDVTPRESFPGQRKLLAEMGTLYAEIARIEVRLVHEGSSTAEVLSSCEPIITGDIAIPFNTRPVPSYKSATATDRFAPPTGKPSAVIVTGKEFQQAVGSGDVVYVNIGSNQGAQAGNHFHIFRTYLSGDDDIFQQATRQYATETGGMRLGRKLDHAERSSLPRTVLGELMLLSVQENTATGIVTLSREDIYPGDAVEME